MPEVHQTHVVLNAKRQANLTHPSLSTARTIHVVTFFEFFVRAASGALFIHATSGMSVQSRPKRILGATSDLSLIASKATPEARSDLTPRDSPLLPAFFPRVS